jgi:hypothetical protein
MGGNGHARGLTPDLSAAGLAVRHAPEAERLQRVTEIVLSGPVRGLTPETAVGDAA